MSNYKKLNINDLNDGDIVIYEDGDVEFKHNSNKAHTSPKLVPDFRINLNELELEMDYETMLTETIPIRLTIVRNETELYDKIQYNVQHYPYGHIINS